MTQEKANLKHVWQPAESSGSRPVNKESILELIRWAPEGISRAEIAQQLGVSRATVSGVVDRLIEWNVHLADATANSTSSTKQVRAGSVSTAT